MDEQPQQTQSPQENIPAPEAGNSSKKWIFIAVGVIVLAFVAGAGYYYTTITTRTSCPDKPIVCPDGTIVRRSPPECKPVECPAFEDIAKNWVPLSSKVVGVEFKHPPEWTPFNIPPCRIDTVDLVRSPVWSLDNDEVNYHGARINITFRENTNPHDYLNDHYEGWLKFDPALLISTSTIFIDNKKGIRALYDSRQRNDPHSWFGLTEGDPDPPDRYDQVYVQNNDITYKISFEYVKEDIFSKNDSEFFKYLLSSIHFISRVQDPSRYTDPDPACHSAG